MCLLNFHDFFTMNEMRKNGNESSILYVKIYEQIYVA